MKHCFTCNNDGFDDKVCPECGRQPGALNLQTLDNIDKFIVKSGKIKIPDEYMGIEWNKGLLLQAHPELSNNKLFIEYVDALDRLHSVFAGGNLLAKSVLICSPSMYSKTTLAYSCMQFGLKHGFRVAELLDTIEVKRLMVLASENTKYRLYNYIDYDTYLMSDILFITVTKTEYRTEAYSVIMEIMDRRSRKGLNTIIISDFDLTTISEKDKLGYFRKMFKSHSNNNFLKYPAFINFWEGLFQ